MNQNAYHAIVCNQIGSIDHLELQTISRNPLKQNELRVQVKACGINFPDKLMIEGKYQFKPELPFIPGMEISGVVVEAHDSKDKSLIGKSVMCQLRHGGYSQEVVVSRNQLIEMPQELSFIEAAGFRVAVQTAYVSLVERANILPGQSILVLGAGGGVGLAAVQIGKALGATIIAVSSTEKKRTVCTESGADYSLDYENLREKVLDITAGKGVDIVFDPVGGEVFHTALRCIKWGGKFLVVGFASGTIPTLQVNLALIKGIALIGVRAGEYFRKFPEHKKRVQTEIFSLLKRASINPHIHSTLKLQDVKKGLKMLDERTIIGRLILIPG